MSHALHGSGRRAVLIAGPTASGKSALALTLAERHRGTIVNGSVDAAENYSVGRWCADAQAALDDIWQQGRLPILVGGTGLYFKALTQGLSAVPPTPLEIRAAVRARCDAEGAEALHAELSRRDPAMAGRLKRGDRMRVARALEVLEATGRSLADWQRDGMPAMLDAEAAVKIFLVVERAELHRRIDDRFDAMLEAGALDEVRVLAARNLDPMLPAMKAHGVPWLRRHLAGEITLAEAAEGGKSDTRRYTKRQVTWFRHQMPGWTWLAPEDIADAVARELGH
jgi:tRNA dimethylallyltransferase